MPETEENKQDLVDIDTSGPGAEIELEEEKVKQVIEERTHATNQKRQNKVKANRLLVSLSSTHYCAYTRDLSNL